MRIAVQRIGEPIRDGDWCRLLWRDKEGIWNRAIGYIKPCKCGDGDYHMIQVEPVPKIRCVNDADIIVFEYLDSQLGTTKIHVNAVVN